jgi:hypothetical protein
MPDVYVDKRYSRIEIRWRRPFLPSESTAWARAGHPEKALSLVMTMKHGNLTPSAPSISCMFAPEMMALNVTASPQILDVSSVNSVAVASPCHFA